MLNHVVEFIGLLRMTLLHGGYDVHHPTPSLRGSEMTTRTKKNELRDIAIVKANPTTIRPAIFSNLEPNDIGFVVEAPRFHRPKPPR